MLFFHRRWLISLWLDYGDKSRGTWRVFAWDMAQFARVKIWNVCDFGFCLMFCGRFQFALLMKNLVLIFILKVRLNYKKNLINSNFNKLILNYQADQLYDLICLPNLTSCAKPRRLCQTLRGPCMHIRFEQFSKPIKTFHSERQLSLAR